MVWEAWVWGAGWGEGVAGTCRVRPGSPAGLSSLVPGAGYCWGLSGSGRPSVGWVSLLGLGRGVGKARDLKAPGSRLV